MRKLLGLLMVLIVSGEEETIEGILGESVLLPCSCLGRNEDKEFKWQKDEPTPVRSLLVHKENMANFSGYSDRADIFLQSNRSNCSLLLNNITAEDEGQYSCRFYIEKRYKKSVVQLNIYAKYSVCLKDLGADGVQCDATGHYGEAEIQWGLNGQLLPASKTPPTNMTWDAVNGRYHFTSKLPLSLTGPNSTTDCVVKAKGLLTTIPECTTTPPGPVKVVGSDPRIYGFLTLIPIMAVFGFGLIFLWRRRGFSQRLPKTREAETDNLYC